MHVSISDFRIFDHTLGSSEQAGLEVGAFLFSSNFSYLPLAKALVPSYTSEGVEGTHTQSWLYSRTGDKKLALGLLPLVGMNIVARLGRGFLRANVQVRVQCSEMFPLCCTQRSYCLS